MIVSDQSRYSHLASYLTSVGATLPPLEFIGVVSNLYHDFEAASYNNRHPEIFKSVTIRQWRKMLQRIEHTLPAKVAVLDLGCGTGFASMIVLDALSPQRIQLLVGADPSVEMLKKSRSTLGSTAYMNEFVCGFIEAFHQSDARFDLIITNSVVHHVFDLSRFFEGVHALLNPEGFYIAGHEPNTHYRTNRWVYGLNRLHNHSIKWRRQLKPRVMARTLLRKAGLKPMPISIPDQINQALLDKGIIHRKLDPPAIIRMVDIHVPTAKPSPYLWGLAGLDAATLLNYIPGFTLIEAQSYHHIKGYTRLQFPWNVIDKTLAQVYPQAGADFIALYQKTA